MILTECPSCNRPHIFDLEIDRHGWFPEVCGGCGKIMWVEATRLAGKTYDTDGFFTNVVKAGDEDEVRAAEVATLAGEGK